MAVGKFDSGIAHLLTANEEDRPFVQDPHGILNTSLWEQFERTKIFNFLISLNGNPDSDLDFPVDSTFLDALFRAMDPQDRIFLEGTIWALRENLDLNSISPNIYTQGRLYSGLKDLCLLTESLLRKKQVADQKIPRASRIMLGDSRPGGQLQPGLLTNALDGQNIGYPQTDLDVSANELQQLLDKLEHILHNSRSPEVRRVYCLHLVRNFTGHHFDLSENTTSPTGKSFFDMYEASLSNILSAILYFKQINNI